MTVVTMLASEDLDYERNVKPECGDSLLSTLLVVLWGNEIEGCAVSNLEVGRGVGEQVMSGVGGDLNDELRIAKFRARATAQPAHVLDVTSANACYMWFGIAGEFGM